MTGDWDGDGDTDLGVYDSATATFTLRQVDATGMEWLSQVGLGAAGYLPVVGDWDANGVTDLGVWDPETRVVLDASGTVADQEGQGEGHRVRYGIGR